MPEQKDNLTPEPVAGDIEAHGLKIQFCICFYVLVMTPMPWARIEPSQHDREYVFVSQHKQALPVPVGDVLLGIKTPWSFLLFFGIIWL